MFWAKLQDFIEYDPNTKESEFRSVLSEIRLEFYSEKPELIIYRFQVLKFRKSRDFYLKCDLKALQIHFRFSPR